MLRLLTLMVLGLAATPAAAGSSDRQLWSNAVVNLKLSDRWRLQEEVTGRWSHNRGGFYELESNSLVGLRLSKMTTVWAGYTHNPQYSSGAFKIMERRAREQITFDGLAKIGGGKLNGRIRLEQRWRDGVDGTGWRARPYLKYVLPLAGKTTLNLSTEPFFNLNTTPFQNRTGLDRIRNLATIAVPLGHALTGEVGYLNQHGFVRNAPDTNDHVAYFGLTMNL